MGEIYLRVLFSRAGLPAASFNMLSIRVGAAREHAAAAEPEHADCILGRKTKERLYAARLRFDDSYTGISCSSRQGAGTTVLRFLRFVRDHFLCPPASAPLAFIAGCMVIRRRVERRPWHGPTMACMSPRALYRKTAT